MLKKLYLLETQFVNGSNLDPCTTDPQLALEELYQQYLNDNPRDLQMLLYFALVVERLPLADPRKALLILECLLLQDPYHIYALLMVAFINSYYRYIDETIVQRLLLLTPNTYEEYALIHYMLSWGI